MTVINRKSCITMNLEHQYISVNNITLHTILAGPNKGEPIMLLHGFPDAWFGWSNQIDELVASGFRVIVPDQRGYNLSSKPIGIGSYVIDNLIKDILELMTKLGYNAVNLAGHDWGAMIAWNIALHYPERVRKLIIMNVPHPKVMGKFLKSYAPQRRKSWYIFFFQIPLFPELFVKLFNWRFLASQMSKNISINMIQQYKKAWSQKKAISSMINWYRAGRKRSNLRWTTPRVNIPTLLIWGENDKFLDVKMAKSSIDFCDNGKLEIIENSSHWVHQDQPERVNSLILTFLR